MITRQFRGNAPTVRGLLLIPDILFVAGAADCASLLPKAPGLELGPLGVDLALRVATDRASLARS